jgi:hypothetical protein
MPFSQLLIILDVLLKSSYKFTALFLANPCHLIRSNKYCIYIDKMTTDGRWTKIA